MAKDLTTPSQSKRSKLPNKRLVFHSDKKCQVMAHLTALVN